MSLSCHRLGLGRAHGCIGCGFPPPPHQLGGQGVERLLPEPPEAIDPDVDLAQGIGLHGVEAPPPIGPHHREPRLTQDPQVLGHRGLRDAVLGPDDVDDVARGRLAVGEELEDAAPDGIAQHVERVHGDNISDLTYMRRGDARPVRSRR